MFFVVGTPPAGPVEDGMIETFVSRKRGDRFGQDGWARRRTARVKGAALIKTFASGKHGIPVDGAKKRPGAHRAHVDAVTAGRIRNSPAIHQPTQLLFPSTAVVDLGENDCPMITLPCLLDACEEPRLRQRQAYPDRSNI